MAISNSAVWEFRPTATAANVNGGFFVTGASGTDYSQQDAAQYALTGCTSSGAGDTVLHASAAADMVGNGARVISGTNFQLTGPWFEILSVVAGVSMTFGTNRAGLSICTGAGASGVINIGGAMSLGNTMDHDIISDMGAGGHKGWFKSGTYTTGETVTGANNATNTPMVLEGYHTTRGDTPTGTNRPLINYAAFTFGVSTTAGSSAGGILRHLSFTGTTPLGVYFGHLAENCKFTNTSTTAGRGAVNVLQGQLRNCEAISYRGHAVLAGSNCGAISGCYIHDSDIGILSQTTAPSLTAIVDNIIESCVSNAIKFDYLTKGTYIAGNTLFGSLSKTGTAIRFATSVEVPAVQNNIITGFVTGCSNVVTNTRALDDWNCYWNNTNDVSAAGQWQKGPNSFTADPQFRDVGQLTGATATTSGSVLTQSGGDFSAVVDNRDFLYLVSGTGITAGQYLITGHTATTVTLDIAPGANATADKVWQITTGRDFSPGSTVRNKGEPNTFPAGLTTSFPSVGAVQRRANAGFFTF